MRDGILMLFIVSTLFVSMEGIAESVDDASFHKTHHAHADEAGEKWFPDSDGSNHEGDACDHFCHAHAVALTTQMMVQGAPVSRYFVPVLPAHTVSYSSAPPTPPPNS